MTPRRVGSILRGRSAAAASRTLFSGCKVRCMLTGADANTLVLCYHAVSATWPARHSVTPQHFRTQIERLLARGYRAVTFSAAGEATPQERVVAITFDDGYRSVLESAAPILAELGARATVFVPTSYMGSERPMSWQGIDGWVGTEHEPELMPLSWGQLNELADAGWEIGSHTETHPRLTRVTEPDLRRELTASRATIEDRLGHRCASIAYPYGDVDPRVTAAVFEAGYELGAALPGPLRGWDRLQLRRIGVYHDDRTWRFALKVAVPVRHLRASPLGPLITATPGRLERSHRSRRDATAAR